MKRNEYRYPVFHTLRGPILTIAENINITVYKEKYILKIEQNGASLRTFRGTGVKKKKKEYSDYFTD